MSWQVQNTGISYALPINQLGQTSNGVGEMTPVLRFEG